MYPDLCLQPRHWTRAEVEAQLPALVAVLRRHQARAAYLFGSVVNGDTDTWSDLDIAVLAPKATTDWLDYYNRLAAALIATLQADNIDLVLLDEAPLALQARVVHVGQRLFADDDVAAWADSVAARYADVADWRRENWEVTRQLARQGVTSEVAMIDQERVQRFVFVIRDAVRELRALRGPDAAVYDQKHSRALEEHYLRLACEAALDLGRHVIVKTGLGSPQEYRDVGRLLAQAGVVPPELGKKLEDMAGLRNILVHPYWDIDPRRLDQIMAEDLDTFDVYVHHIFAYLESLP